jgi:putative ABC transport system substrate-binding protein
MRRREFLSVAGGIAAWPLGALGQQAPLPVIGYLSSFTKPLTEKRIGAFGRGLGENGYALGRNVALELRTADNQFERLPGLAAELVAKRVRLIATLAQPAADAARAATSTIPIVFVAASDPVKSGAVRSLARPGGNVTGVTFLTSTLGAKRLEMLREIAPRAAPIAVLVNPAFPESMTELKDVEAAAASLQQPLVILNANSDKEIELAFTEMQRRRPGALLVGTGGLFVQRSALLASLAAQHRVPALYPSAEAPALG